MRTKRRAEIALQKLLTHKPPPLLPHGSLCATTAHRQPRPEAEPHECPSLDPRPRTPMTSADGHNDSPPGVVDGPRR